MSDIKLAGVTRRFDDDVVAVDHVDLDIADGEFVILVGPSGCGKSTLLRMIVGLEDVSEGSVSIGGKDVTGTAPRDRNLAMVFQNYALYPHLTVRGNMEFPLKLKKMPKAEMDERVNRAAASLELEDLLDRKPAQLSGGQRQRVAMGRAIVREPDAFLLDEPLSNLDAKLRVQMRGELGELQARLKTTTVYVTHDQTEAMTLGDRVAVLRKGKLQQVAKPKELYLDPANVFVAGFIGSPAMNFFPATIEGTTVRLPMVEYELPRRLRERAELTDAEHVVVGIRPEHFEDVAQLGSDEREGGVGFAAEVDRLEWLGSELFVHFAVEKPAEGGSQSLREVAEELGDSGVRQEHDALTVARIDPASDIAEGDKAQFWLDTDRIHYFDGDTGENLLRAADEIGPDDRPATDAAPDEVADART